jgi:hypothetical protein
MLFNRLIRSILQPINPAAILILGVFTALWGIWVASPFWDVFTSADAYQYLGMLPEPVVGGVAILAGLGIINGVLRASFRSLTTGAMIGFSHWFTIAVFFFLGNWHNTAGITYLMIAVYSAFVWLNLRVNRNYFAQ